MSKHSQNHISRIRILSKSTVVCVLIGWGWLFLIGLSFLLISRIEKQVDNPDTSGILWSLVYLIVISVFASFIFNLIAVVTGVIALKKNGKCSYTLFGIIAGLVGIIVFGILLTAYYSKQRANQISLETAHKELIKADLSALGKAISIYNTEYQMYPTAGKWCDLLLEAPKVLEELNKEIVCPLRGWTYPNEKKCYYAINSNCKTSSEEDVVLLLESKGGWNQFGSSDLLLSIPNRGKGCYILFNDGHIEYVKKEHFSELNWE